MSFLYDFLPIIVFFVIYKLFGIYWATSAAMALSTIQVIFHWLKHRVLEKMQVITMTLIIVLGGATLFLHNPIFIKWKPTAVYWLFAIVFAISHFVFKKPAIKYAADQYIELPEHIWRNLNISWIVFFTILGAINLYVVYHFSTNTWVNFKLFGILGITVLFAIAQSILISKYVEIKEENKIKKDY